MRQAFALGFLALAACSSSSVDDTAGSSAAQTAAPRATLTADLGSLDFGKLTASTGETYPCMLEAWNEGDRAGNLYRLLCDGVELKVANDVFTASCPSGAAQPLASVCASSTFAYQAPSDPTKDVLAVLRTIVDGTGRILGLPVRDDDGKMSTVYAVGASLGDGAGPGKMTLFFNTANGTGAYGSYGPVDLFARAGDASSGLASTSTLEARLRAVIPQ